MFSEGNNPEQRQTFEKGANYDQSPEKVFNNPNSGFYIDAHNMQPTSNNGITGDLEKIKGEQLLYDNETGASGYKCLLSDTVNNKLFELWAPPNNSLPSIARVDGVIVLSSTLLNLSLDYPLQWDASNSFENGYVAFTDRRVPPYEFNVEDMVASLATEKYFSAFDPKLYQINIQSALDIPVFIGIVNVGGGGGLPVGQYQYQIRYASKEGDVTNWSHPTPMIPVMEAISSESEQYPWVKTFGASPNPSSVTSLAPKLRFRVTNLYNYDYMEIKRISYNAGAGVDYTSNGVIVARVDINAGEISIREYVDPQESNITLILSAQDETRELAHIETAGSVRYHDRRLVFGNITYPSKESNLSFLQINGKEGFPVKDKIYKEGYNDPYNAVNYKSYPCGETVGFGVTCYDCVGNKGFVTKSPQLKSYTFPNRRDPVSSETANYSYNGTVKAALSTDTNAVGQCHEVFDLGDRVFKSNACDFKNITQKGPVFGFTGTKDTGRVKQDCDETNEEIENHAADVNLGNVSVAYQPFTPVRQTDTDVTGHNYVVNTKVAKGNVKAGPVVVETNDVKAYRPAGFAPDYYATGMMIAGVDNFPSWAKAFSVVRTNTAKRVVAQGLAYYSLTKGKFKAIANATLGGKNGNQFWFYAPDIDNGIVSSSTVNDIIDNPQNYQLQFVSPLGFFSEWYSAEDNLVASQRDRCIDMISYVRMLRDTVGPDSDVNPMEDPNMGIDGGDGNRYIAYDKFRNLTNIPTTFFADPQKGNKLFNITKISRKAEGRGNYLNIEVDQNVYGTASTGGNSDSNFEDNGLKNFTEPIYIVNIVRTGAIIKDTELQKYKQTTHYQKIESIIGKSTGAQNQVFPLVDERFEDCIPAPKASNYGASTDRFLYIKTPDGTIEKWINVTYKNATDYQSIISDITNGVGDYTGAYTHTNVDNQNRFYEINFNVSTFVPLVDSLIIVRYDNTAPIRVYGGDTYIGESIFAPIDGQASAKDKEAETQFAMGIGLPYKDFKINPRYYTIRKAAAGLNSIQDTSWFTLGFIRQLCAMFTVESRSCMPLAFNSSYPNQFFPLINYVIRPNRWDADKNYADNYIYTDYENDYGSDEKNQWKWGGFRFLPQVNPDYSVEPPIAFFSKPTIGFEEKRVFPTRNMWSLPRAINVQNAPSIKTFPANNSFDIDDNQGEIKYLWSATTGSGENLYAVTERGICMYLTKKSILSDLGASQLGVIGQDTFIGGQYWWSRDIGVPDKMWRGITEASVQMESGTTRQVLFFVNNLSVYQFVDNQIVDISGIYYTKLYNEGILKISSGLITKISSGFDLYKKQFYLNLEGPEIMTTFVFGQDNKLWYGTNDFNFDKFNSHNGKTYGHRDLKTYLLNTGNLIQGQPIDAWFISAFSPESDKEKEFIRVRINSSKKPVKVEFSKQKNQAVPHGRLSATDGPYYLKNYKGWENYVPRVSASVDANRSRFQGSVILCKIFHNLAEDFNVRDVTFEYKKIKT